MRIVIADDSTLLREGLSRLLAEAGHEPVAGVGDGEALLEALEIHQPDLALIDIRMPPTFTHEGSLAATEASRRRWPELGILLLSQSIEGRHALDLARTHPRALRLPPQGPHPRRHRAHRCDRNHPPPGAPCSTPT